MGTVGSRHRLGRHAGTGTLTWLSRVETRLDLESEKAL